MTSKVHPLQIEQFTSKWRQKSNPMQIIESLTSKIIEPLTQKIWGRGCVIQQREKWLRVGLQVWAKKIFWMNDKAIIEFGFRSEAL